jgi:hypothetical protein
LYVCTAYYAGFLFVPGSHLRPLNLKKEPKNDWVPIEDTSLVTNGIKLIIPSNSFVIWNSKSIHANTGMSIKSNKKEINRLTVYVSYLPKRMRSIDVLENKINAYKNGSGTSHWANRCELKKYPWGFGPQYLRKNFTHLVPALTSSGDIPPERLALL